MRPRLAAHPPSPRLKPLSAAWSDWLRCHKLPLAFCCATAPCIDDSPSSDNSSRNTRLISRAIPLCNECKLLKNFMDALPQTVS